MEEELILKVDDVEIYDNDFELAIEEACQKYKIDNLVTEGQRRWKRVMEYVGKRIFGDGKILRDKKLVWLNGNKIPTNNNRFDEDIINILCDYYMSLSDQYNKLISIEAFSLFLGIPRESISLWGKEEPSTMRFRIFKKLKDYRFECLKDHSYDNGNVTGTMYVGNVEYGTNLPGVRQEENERRRLTNKELFAMLEQKKQGEQEDF